MNHTIPKSPQSPPPPRFINGSFNNLLLYIITTTSMTVISQLFLKLQQTRKIYHQPIIDYVKGSRVNISI